MELLIMILKGEQALDLIFTKLGFVMNTPPTRDALTSLINTNLNAS